MRGGISLSLRLAYSNNAAVRGRGSYFTLMYKIVRFYFNKPGQRRTIKTGLTLEQAQAHCSDPETSSSTAKNYTAVKRTKEQGPWFDGYEET